MISVSVVRRRSGRETTASPLSGTARDAAFEASVHRESRRLFLLALAILRDSGEAEDAVQETMMKAWRAWDDFRDRERESAWLTRICVNSCLSRRRHLAARFPLISPLMREPVSREAFDEVDLDLDRACRQVSARQRALLILHYHHGYTLDECAALMRCRPGTVRSHLARALSTLQREVERG
ncbi:MAG TPA: RNA polymerase sigma factor [Candidatus Sulfotelmatobacter sp.]|nr:RNA polymerase sigma factor [Candidatus Sulfotelmatobacter sp.]